MIRNYLLIAWRNLWKNKVFSLINIIGLSLSVSFCLLLFFLISQERSYDMFHKKGNRLFRLEMTDVWSLNNPPPTRNVFTKLTRTDETPRSVSFPLVVGTDLLNNFPEIKSVTRFKDASHHFGDALIRAGSEVFKESHVMYADENFFDNLSFAVIRGNGRSALSSPGQMVLTASLAKKYFGDQEPIGKTLSFINDSNRLFTVAAIAADPPENSGIRFSMILPIQSDPGYQRNLNERFNQADHIFLLELANGASSRQLEAKLDHWVKGYFADYISSYSKFVNVYPGNFHWYLRPLADCHYMAGTDWDHFTDMKSMYQLSCLAFVILVIASLNYVLLKISNAASRSQEIGVRKVMGARRPSIILQFWMETQVIVCIAVLFGLVLSRSFVSFFNLATGSRLGFADITWNEILIALAGFSLLLGILAGYYPALLLSKMKPSSIIMGSRTFKINPGLSRMLVVVQFSACVVFLIASSVIHQQMEFINHKDLGFDREQVLLVKNQTYDPGLTAKIRDRFSVFAKTDPSILKFSSMLGGLNGMSNSNGFVLNGEQRFRKHLAVDYDYFDLLDLPLVKGRNFSRFMATDSARSAPAAVVNETLFRMLGKSARLGTFNEALHETIIGVVKDYHFESLANHIEPEDHVLAGNFITVFMFRIKGGKTQQAIRDIENEWKQVTGNYPFEFSFLDQTLASMYEPQMRWQKTVQASSLFAIFIACMGLFGLSAINASNRKKEIGIRKVLGAEMRDIVGSLSRNFVAMVLIAILVAIPLAAWLMNRWLNDFAYRIQIRWWTYVVAGVAALLVAFLAVSVQAVRAALVNPVTSLRNE